MAYRAAPPRARTLLALAITIAACVQHSAAANTRSLTSARALASHSRGFENEHEARAASALWKQWLDSGDDSSMGALHAAWVQEHHTTEGGRAAAAADPARFSNFKATLGRIAAINADTTKTWFAGLNDRADLPRAQQLRPVMSVPFLKATADDNSTYRKVAKSYDGPPDVDWRAKGAVTPVKDQGSCGSCWAFATIGALESAILVAGGSSSDLSEEYLVSCFYAGTKEDGCQGGWPDQAAEFIAKNGVPTESALPYTDGKSGKASACPKPAKPIAAVSNGVGTVEHSASGLLTAVSKRPAAFAMFVDKDISLYSGGIYKSKMTNPNHAMLLVGFVTSASQPYWIVKNSWGPKWGEQGFLRVALEDDDSPGQGSMYTTAGSWPLGASLSDTLPTPSPKPDPSPGTPPSPDDGGDSSDYDYSYADYDYADYAPECTGLGWDGSYFSKGTKVSTTTASSFNDCALQTFDSDGASFNFDSDKGTCTVLKESYTKLQKYLKPKSTMMAGYPDPDTCS